MASRKIKELTEHDAIYSDPDTTGIILRRLLFVEGQYRKLAERLNYIDKRVLNLEDGE